jgi:uncharacterized protein (TIGR00369 family)
MSDAPMSAQEKLTAVLASIPYARFIGVRAELAGDEMTAVLPFSDLIVGNPILPAIHGGVLGAFMEMTALAQLSILEPLKRQPRTIDVSIEYLRSGRPLTTYARAEIKKVGRRIANVHVEAWQEQRANPIAALRGHFLLTSSED